MANKVYRKNINWLEIEHRYITGNESYKELSKIYNLRSNQIAQYGKANEWVKKRDEYRLSVISKAKKQSEKSAVENLKELGQVAGRAVYTMSEYFDAEGMVYEPNEFRQLTSALKDLTAVLKDIYDITENEVEDTNTIKLQVVMPEGMEEYGS